MWNVLSFREISFSDKELQKAQAQARNLDLQKSKVRETVYRFEMFKHHNKNKEHPVDQNDGSLDFSKYSINISDKVILFVNGTNILIKRENDNWKSKVIKNWQLTDA
ncbi:hypothetical protein [Priestia megaterium]|uniref:hypothetical protein n=1 Tax=Priestia megaterium TaxID=1404 RepID=UPI00406BACC8